MSVTFIVHMAGRLRVRWLVERVPGKGRLIVYWFIVGRLIIGRLAVIGSSGETLIVGGTVLGVARVAAER